MMPMNRILRVLLLKLMIKMTITMMEVRPIQGSRWIKENGNEEDPEDVDGDDNEDDDYR